jgi:hypothetical protein
MPFVSFCGASTAKTHVQNRSPLSWGMFLDFGRAGRGSGADLTKIGRAKFPFSFFSFFFLRALRVLRGANFFSFTTKITKKHEGRREGIYKPLS